MKREARQEFYRRMHEASPEIYEAGQEAERERIIELIEGWCYPRYIGASYSTPDEIELLEDLIEAIKGENE